jgi:LL-diaminopimelate aminotransferase
LNKYFDSDFSRELKHNNDIFRERLNLLAQGLTRAGLEVRVPNATFYLWVNVGMDGGAFVRRLLDLGVVATPGGAFGNNGINYVRFSVTRPTDMIVEAAQRVEKLQLQSSRKNS